MRFRAVLFRMVPKHATLLEFPPHCFRAVLFRMVPKRFQKTVKQDIGFRAVLFRMVPKLIVKTIFCLQVLELCCFEWFQNTEKVVRAYP